MASFDFHYHGKRRDVSEPATLNLENPAAPKITHPAQNWTKTSIEEVQKQVRVLRDRNPNAPVFGIGHSMGGAALWMAEVANPGTFDGLILFEPACNMHELPNSEMIIPVYVSFILSGQYRWDSYEEAETYFRSTKAYARWHPEALAAFIQGAVVKNEPPDYLFGIQSAYTLACHPHIEAAHYMGQPCFLSMEEMGRVRCQVVLQYGSRTQMFPLKASQKLAHTYPLLYRVDMPLPKATHMMITEDPDTAAERIMSTLHQFPAFGSSTESAVPRL
ncbi:hypothetical protein Poli38472_003889 [Pythium oligandrum]|uniref:Serine aminopeptidase S33 domain-containing protein n=1 Tax=Pythium oligandrum TaxID=41045 RepID=A0A8K1CN32_PYTOL|nr:hypothetical protein Poli38472_003889 [Pythium oligandrum]|eukprot:TMW66124.1 hypothetical protein Poli38472_003889 [Pythium oligandrum]